MDITFIITTYKRPQCLRILQESIKKYYPSVSVLVYDDTEFDRGVSWARNYLISQIKTKYFLILDDDFVFNEDTIIEKLYKKAERGYDIVAGSILQDNEIIHYEGFYQLEDDILKLVFRKKEPFDFVFQFLVGRTEKFKECKWDEEIKIGEHTAFFFDNKGKLKIGYEPSVIIEHLPIKKPEYMFYRNRATTYFKKWMNKRNIKEVIKIYE